MRQPHPIFWLLFSALVFLGCTASIVTAQDSDAGNLTPLGDITPKNCPLFTLATNQNEVIASLNKETQLRSHLMQMNRQRTFAMLGDTTTSFYSNLDRASQLASGASEIFMTKFHLRQKKDEVVSMKNDDAKVLAALNNKPTFYIGARGIFNFELERRHPRSTECWAEFDYTEFYDNGEASTATAGLPVKYLHIILKAPQKINRAGIHREFSASRVVCPQGVKPKNLIPDGFYPALYSSKNRGAEKGELSEIGFVLDQRQRKAQRYLMTEALKEMAPGVDPAKAMKQALEHWSGFYFDSASLLQPYQMSMYGIRWEDQVGRAKSPTEFHKRPASEEQFLHDWNKGVDTLLSRRPSPALERVPESATIITNGRLRIQREAKTGKIRYQPTVAMLGKTQTYIEGFCFEPDIKPGVPMSWAPKRSDWILDDLWLWDRAVKSYGATTFHKVNMYACPVGSSNGYYVPGATEAEVRKTVRSLQTFCQGVGLLGYRPGRTFTSFGNIYRANAGIGEINSDAPEAYFDPGEPIREKNPYVWPEQSKYHQKDFIAAKPRALNFSMIPKTKVATRSFERAKVYVNLGESPETILNEKEGYAIVLQEDAQGAAYESCIVPSNSTISLPAKSSIMLKTDGDWEFPKARLIKNCNFVSSNS